MKTVITSSGDTLNASFDLRFGRAGWFCIFDEETGGTDFKKNEYAEARGGAGTKAAEMMVGLGIKKVISGDFGPKAKDLLEKFNIQMVIVQNENHTVLDIINKIK